MKTKTRSQLAPAVFGLGGAVRSEDVREVVEAQAYALGEAVDAWGTHCFTSGTPTPVERENLDGGTVRSFEVSVPAWAVQVEVEVEVDPGAGVTSVDVDVDVGAASDTLTLAGPWRDAVQLDVSATGAGYVLVVVGGTAVGGVASLDSVLVRVVPLDAADLPDPA